MPGAHGEATGLLTVTLVVPGAVLAGEAMSGEPQNGLRSNAIGVGPVVLASTLSWVLNGGTTYSGTVSSKVIGKVPEVSASETPGYGVCEVVRGSSWYVSGSTPVFLTLMFAVTWLPGASVPVGRPVTLTLDVLKLTVPLSVAW